MKNNAVLLKFYICRYADTKICKFLSKEEVYMDNLMDYVARSYQDHNIYYRYVPIDEVKTKRNISKIIKSITNI